MAEGSEWGRVRVRRGTGTTTTHRQRQPDWTSALHVTVPSLEHAFCESLWREEVWVPSPAFHLVFLSL